MRVLLALLVFVAFGNVEKLQTEFVRGAWLKTQSDLECWASDVVFGGDIAAELKPDVLLVAVNVNGVSAVDG